MFIQSAAASLSAKTQPRIGEYYRAGYVYELNTTEQSVMIVSQGNITGGVYLNWGAPTTDISTDISSLDNTTATDLMISEASSYIASYARSYVLNGVTGWDIPTIATNQLIQERLWDTGIITGDRVRWSSTGYGGSEAWYWYYRSSAGKFTAARSSSYDYFGVKKLYY